MADNFVHLSFVVSLSQDAADFAVALNDAAEADDDQGAHPGSRFIYENGALSEGDDGGARGVNALDTVARIIKATLAHFDIDYTVVIDWSRDCNGTPRSDQVTIVTTKDGSHSMSAAEWLTQVSDRVQWVCKTSRRKVACRSTINAQGCCGADHNRQEANLED